MFKEKKWDNTNKYKQMRKDHTDLTRKVKRSRYFGKLEKDMQNKIKDHKDWHTIKGKKRIENAGLEKFEVKFLHTHLSTYVHSSLFSFIIEDKTLNYNEIQSKIKSVKFYAYTILALALDDFRRLSLEVKYFLTNEEITNKIIKQCQQLKVK